MYMGKIVEHADRLSLFNNPQHPYTQALLSAVPTVDKAARAAQKRILIPGDPPDPTNLPTGCRFANRCPVAIAKCSKVEPDLLAGNGTHRTACHLVGT
jgi:peptide/nickel transport system ATP-binding protein